MRWDFFWKLLSLSLFSSLSLSHKKYLLLFLDSDLRNLDLLSFGLSARRNVEARFHIGDGTVCSIWWVRGKKNLISNLSDFQKKKEKKPSVVLNSDLGKLDPLSFGFSARRNVWARFHIWGRDRLFHLTSSKEKKNTKVAPIVFFDQSGSKKSLVQSVETARLF